MLKALSHTLLRELQNCLNLSFAPDLQTVPSLPVTVKASKSLYTRNLVQMALKTCKSIDQKRFTYAVSLTKIEAIPVIIKGVYAIQTAAAWDTVPINTVLTTSK